MLRYPLLLLLLLVVVVVVVAVVVVVVLLCLNLYSCSPIGIQRNVHFGSDVLFDCVRVPSQKQFVLPVAE
jgi:uncharacterized membrane protein